MFLIILYLFVAWPSIATSWASDMEETQKGGATLSQIDIFSNIQSSLGVLFSGMTVLGAFCLLMNGIEQLNFQKETKKVDDFYNAFSRGSNNINIARSGLFYCDKGIINPKSGDRIEISGIRLLVESGRLIDELMDNLSRAEVNGFKESFANSNNFAEIFINNMETSFQMFAACAPWMGAFLNAMDDLKRYGESYAKEKERCREYLQTSLTRQEKMLIAAFCIAKGREEVEFVYFKNFLFENTSPVVQECMTDLLQTYDLYGDGAFARIKIIEKISGLVCENIKGLLPEKLTPILIYAAKNTVITLKQACDLAMDEEMAIRMIKLAKLAGWMKDANHNDRSDDNETGDLYYITPMGQKFVEQFQS